MNLLVRRIEFLVWLIPLTVTLIFFWILSELIIEGIAGLTWGFLWENPVNSGREGGIASIIVATLMMLAICLVVSIPIGMGTALYLVEYCDANSSIANFIRMPLDILASVPSIVMGLFGNAFFCVFLGLGYSILSGGLTLAVMVLPFLIRVLEEGFKDASAQVKKSAVALGITRPTLIKKLLIPLAIPTIAVGVVLAISRALAETAALIFTSGYVDRMPESVLDSGRSISIHILDLAMNVPGGDSNAYTTALILVIIIIAINSSSYTIANYFVKRRLA